MDRNFYNNNDFEEFLKQKANQYKMYPSDRVWNNIYSTLHGRRKWLVLGFTLLFISSSLFIGRQAVLSNYNTMATQLNKGPEMLSPSAIAPARNIHQYILPVHAKPAGKYAAGYTAATKEPLVKNIPAYSTPASLPAEKDNNKIAASTAETAPLVIENNLLPAMPETPAKLTEQTGGAAEKQPAILKSPTAKTNLLKESAKAVTIQNEVAAVKPVKPSKWFLQLYASPIISYRRLSNESQPSYTPPLSASYAGNINKYVHHQPAPGFEAGGKVLYKLSDNLSIYAGAQLNYSRYYIDAYKYRIEKASIALDGARSLSGYTDIRNFSGYEPEQLQNRYWQLSVPIGIEIKLLGDKKLQLNVAGGVQPTFLINSNSYLISSDYKNYIQSPDLARSFNVHTNFETFISYKTGGIKWQLGPQFRSQLLSSYSNQYRVREYLTEFGIKFGITKSFR